MPIQFYTEEEVKVRYDLLNSFWNLNHQGYDTKKNKDYFPCIPFNLNSLLGELTIVKEYIDKKEKETTEERAPHKSFLDIGCGQGHVLLAAKSFGFSTYGIEYNEDALPHWIHSYDNQNLITQDKIDKVKRKNVLKSLDYSTIPYIFLCDALEFKEYSEFDVLYMYVPICNNKIMDKLLRLVLDKMKPGAILIANSLSIPQTRKDYSMKRISNMCPIYVKEKIEKEVIKDA